MYIRKTKLMRKTKLAFEHLLFLSLMFVLPSCTHYYYGPNSNNVPLLKQKNDVAVVASFAAASESSGFEFQFADAFANHFGGMLNFYTTQGKETGSNNSYSKGSATLIEIGGGYFTPVADRWVFETYAGIGTGTVNNSYSQTESSKVNATKLFIQPSFGYKNNAGTFQAAISSRFNSVKLNLQQSSILQVNHATEYTRVQDLKSNGDNIYWEPSFLIRGGFRSVLFQLQYTTSNGFKTHTYLTEPDLISIGAFFYFSAKPSK
jgi:hypothetical protein